MYIQITTRCNMTCAHCCYSCTAEGEDMSTKTFRAALKHCGYTATLGGGEPTLHPQFEKFLLLAVVQTGECGEGGVHVITNGSNATRAKMLFGLAKAGIIGAELSLDDYHDPIDSETESMWRKEAERARSAHSPYSSSRETSNVGIRNTTEYQEPMANGRACTELGYEKGEDYHCPGGGPVVKPNGDVYACGCDAAVKIGDVFGGFSVPDSEDYQGSQCSRALLEEVPA